MRSIWWDNAASRWLVLLRSVARIKSFDRELEAQNGQPLSTLKSEAALELGRHQAEEPLAHTRAANTVPLLTPALSPLLWWAALARLAPSPFRLTMRERQHDDPSSRAQREHELLGGERQSSQKLAEHELVDKTAFWLSGNIVRRPRPSAQFAATKLSAPDLSKTLERFGALSQKARAEVNHVLGQIGKVLSRRS